jgi:hypothetical protein
VRDTPKRRKSKEKGTRKKGEWGNQGWETQQWDTQVTQQEETHNTDAESQPPQQAPRGSKEEAPKQIPIFEVPLIWEPCVLDWKGTEVACKVLGATDPARPRYAALADCKGERILSDQEKKWLGKFLAHAPPRVTWADPIAQVHPILVRPAVGARSGPRVDP